MHDDLQRSKDEANGKLCNNSRETRRNATNFLVRIPNDRQEDGNRAWQTKLTIYHKCTILRMSWRAKKALLRLPKTYINMAVAQTTTWTLATALKTGLTPAATSQS